MRRQEEENTRLWDEQLRLVGKANEASGLQRAGTSRDIDEARRAHRTPLVLAGVARAEREKVPKFVTFKEAEHERGQQ